MGAIFKIGVYVIIILFFDPLYSGVWKVIHSFPAPSGDTNGMAWDGKDLWHSNERDPILYKLDPISGNVLATVTTHVPDQGDIAFHHGQMWVNSENEHMIYLVDLNTGETVKRILFDVSIIPDPGRRRNGQFEGLTSDGTSLWLDYLGDDVYRVDPVSGRRLLKYSRDFRGYADGLAWGWGSMFMATNSTEILEIDACSGTILDIFKAPAGVNYGPEGLTFDGEYLWFADNTTDRIYQIQLMDDYFVKRSAKKSSMAAPCTDDNENILKHPELMIPGIDIGGNGPDALLPLKSTLNLPTGGITEFFLNPRLSINGLILPQNNLLRLDGKVIFQSK